MSKPLPMLGSVAGPPLVFEHVAIVGLGRLGVSLGLASRQRWPAGIVIGVDDHEGLERAIRLHAVDVGAPDLAILAGAELIILTGSPDRNAAVLGKLPDQVDGPAVVTGINGDDDCRAAPSALPARFSFVAGRPLLDAADAGDAPAAELVSGLDWRLKPAGARPAEAEAHRRLVAFLTALGAEVRVGE